MKNRLSDLNDHLFMQMERLGDEDMNPEELAQEIARAKSMTGVANQVINNARLVLDAQTRVNDSFNAQQEIPRLLT
jgi:hypothetical protein